MMRRRLGLGVNVLLHLLMDTALGLVITCSEGTKVQQ